MASGSCREVVVVGMKRTGKRSLGNSLLDREAFNVEPFAIENTKDFEKKSNNEIVVTITPALFNTAESFSDTALKMISDQNGCQNPHAFLIVFDPTRQRGIDFRRTRRELTIIFGKTCFNHAIIVFTNVKDTWTYEMCETHWQKNKEMQKLVKACGERVARIDNQGNRDEKLIKAKEIIRQVDNLSENGRRRFNLPSKLVRENIFEYNKNRCRQNRSRSGLRDETVLFEEEMKRIKDALKKEDSDQPSSTFCCKNIDKIVFFTFGLVVFAGFVSWKAGYVDWNVLKKKMAYFS